MSGTAMPPTKAVTEAAALLEDGVGRFLAARKSFPKLGKFESDLEALFIFYLVIRHIESICTLAKCDLVMLPSALTVARGAFEATVKILWMLHPDEVFEREARWLAYLAGEEDYLLRTASLLAEFGHEERWWTESAKSTHKFRIGVEKLLPSTKPLKALPNFRAMLKDIGQEQHYLKYMRLSQFAHGTHVAGELYRNNLGNGKVHGEFIYPESWAEPLNCAWWCLATGGTTILKKLGGEPGAFADKTYFNRIAEALSKV